jgi:hypothetical protein
MKVQHVCRILIALAIVMAAAWHGGPRTTGGETWDKLRGGAPNLCNGLHDSVQNQCNQGCGAAYWVMKPQTSGTYVTSYWENDSQQCTNGLPPGCPNGLYNQVEVIIPTCTPRNLP